MARPDDRTLTEELARRLHADTSAVPWETLARGDRDEAIARVARALDGLVRGPLWNAAGAWYRAGREAAVDALDTIEALGRDPGWPDDAARRAMTEQAARSAGDLRLRWDAGVPRTDTTERLARALVATALRGEHADGCPVRAGAPADTDPDPWLLCACDVKTRAPIRAAWIVGAGGVS